MENNASLSNLHINLKNNSNLFSWFNDHNGIYDTILDNPKFISVIKRFSFVIAIINS